MTLSNFDFNFAYGENRNKTKCLVGWPDIEQERDNDIDFVPVQSAFYALFTTRVILI